MTLKNGNGSPHYDLLVIGSGPAGQRAAVQAAKLRKRVAIIDKCPQPGGVCVNSGTIPSKSFREAVLYLSGYQQRHIYGASYRVKTDITMTDLTFRCKRIIQQEIEVINAQLKRNHVDMITGHASFLDTRTLQITNDGVTVVKSADNIIIAVGAAPFRPSNIPFNDVNIFDSDTILDMPEIPRTMLVVGGGVIGIEYASMFAALGVHVTIVDSRKKLLEFIDQEIVESLVYQMRENGVTFRLGETVESCRVQEQNQVCTQLKSGKVIMSDTVLVSAGRQSATTSLNLTAAGITTEERGRLVVNEHGQTTVPHIYGAGDVIGFPALASTSAEQGRLASCHAFGVKGNKMSIPLPYGIYSIPEISTVGESEEQLTEKGVPYETGVARYKEIARGHLMGDESGMLKIIFHRETKKLLGVHIIGDEATELIHIGQAAIALGGGLDYLINCVFNYPTLAECYKVAALDGYNKTRS